MPPKKQEKSNSERSIKDSRFNLDKKKKPRTKFDEEAWKMSKKGMSDPTSTKVGQKECELQPIEEECMVLAMYKAAELETTNMTIENRKIKTMFPDCGIVVVNPFKEDKRTMVYISTAEAIVLFLSLL